MKILFASLVLSCAFALFAEEKDPKIEVVPMSVTISRTKMLSDKKKLKKIAQLQKHCTSISVAQPSFEYEEGNDFSFELKIVFLGKVKNCVIKKIIVESLEPANDKAIMDFKTRFREQWDEALLAEIFSYNKNLASIKKFDKIQGVAILEKRKNVCIQIKDLLSIKDEKFTNKELQKNGIEVQLNNVEHNKLKITLNSKEKTPPDFDFIVTITNRPYPADFYAETLWDLRDEPVDQATSVEDSSDGTSRSTVTSFCQGNEFSFYKKQLTKDSTLILEIKIPEKEFKVPFCFENIPL
jgi:hypothetical protein